MSQSYGLSHALKACYQKEGILHHLSCSMEKEMVLKSLVLNDVDLHPAEIHCLSRFLSSNEAANSIETLIIISKPVSVQRAKGDSQVCQSHSNFNVEDRASTAFSHKLLKAAISFITNSLKLHTVVIDSVRIKAELLSLLGNALSTTKSVVRWLSFKSTLIGSSGIKVLGPHISKMHIQVLVFEQCGLGDDSCLPLSKILKCQETTLDSLFWNTTLRSDYTASSLAASTKQKAEIDLVFSQGLVALSLMGNRISGRGLGFLRRAIHSNHWLLGLNLARNQIELDGINLFATAMKTGNNALHAVLIKGNPGGSVENISVLKESCCSNFPSRLDLMPKGVSILLKKWMTLQSAEKSGLDISINNSNTDSEELSFRIKNMTNGEKVEHRYQNQNRSVIEEDKNRIQNGIVKCSDIDAEYKDFKNGFDRYESLRKIAKEESHLDADQRWMDDEGEEDVERERGVKIATIGYGDDSDSDNDLNMGSEDDDDDIEALSTDVVVGNKNQKYVSEFNPWTLSEYSDHEDQILGQGGYRPPSRQSLKPRSQSIISEFASGPGSLSVRSNVNSPQYPYQSCTTNVEGEGENRIASHSHSYDLAQDTTPIWMNSTTMGPGIGLGVRPSSAPGTRRGRSEEGRAYCNNLGRDHPVETLEWSNPSPCSTITKNLSVGRVHGHSQGQWQESSATPSRRHSIDGHPTPSTLKSISRILSTSRSSRSSSSVRRQEEMSRRLTAGAATVRIGPFLSSTQTRLSIVRSEAYKSERGINANRSTRDFSRSLAEWGDETFLRKSVQLIPKKNIFQLEQKDSKNSDSNRSSTSNRNRNRNRNSYEGRELLSSEMNKRGNGNQEGWIGMRAKSFGEREGVGRVDEEGEGRERGKIQTDGLHREQESLEEIIDQFKESVTDINRTLCGVSAQLNYVNNSFLESMGERSLSRQASPYSNTNNQSPLRSMKNNNPIVRTSYPHTTTTVLTDHNDIVHRNSHQDLQSYYPPHTDKDCSFTEGMVTVTDNGHTSLASVVVSSESPPLDILGQTLGRCRGSLMHRTKGEDSIRVHYSENENFFDENNTWQLPIPDKDPSSLLSERDRKRSGWRVPSPSFYRTDPGVVVDRALVSKDIDMNMNGNEYGQNTNNIKSLSSAFSSSHSSSHNPSPSHSFSLSPSHSHSSFYSSSPTFQREEEEEEEEGEGEREYENGNGTVISTRGISLLIRDRLKNKLESILRPFSIV